MLIEVNRFTVLNWVTPDQFGRARKHAFRTFYFVVNTFHTKLFVLNIFNTCPTHVVFFSENATKCPWLKMINIRTKCLRLLMLLIQA